MSEDNSYATEFVPSKVEEVQAQQKPTIHDPIEEHLSQNLSIQTKLPSSSSKPSYENAYHVVSEL